MRARERSNTCKGLKLIVLDPIQETVALRERIFHVGERKRVMSTPNYFSTHM